MIYVATVRGRFFPEKKGCRKVIPLTKSSKDGDLGPYVLCNDGRIVENEWQFSKLYGGKVPEQKIPWSRWDKRVIWEHPAEIHADEESRPNEAYWAWREKGMRTPDPVRYPVGRKARKQCIGAVIGTRDNYEIVNYIEARKRIYVPLYEQAALQNPKLHRLVEVLKKGTPLIIYDVDGPRGESLDYYKEKYGVADDFIVDDIIDATDENLDILLNDDRHPYGHGFCLARLLRRELGVSSSKKLKLEK